MIHFVDVQGTLLSDSDKSPIYGSKNLIRYFNEHSLPYVVITNNTKLKSEEFLKNLKAKGLEVRSDGFIDPFCVLDGICKPCKAALFGAPAFVKTMKDYGFIEDFKSPEAVIIASFDGFCFDDFAKIIELVNAGAKLIAMHATSTYKKGGKLYPGVGAIASMLEYATGIKAQIVGKPSRLFYEAALNKAAAQLGIKDAHFSDVNIISDDARGDLLGAKELGMKTTLVLSGKVAKLENAGVSRAIIDSVFSHVGGFLESLEEHRI